MKISDLKAAPYNPRKISKESLSGLGYSIEEFGDLSGIVFNQKTGNLVCGHQRLTVIKNKYDDLKIKNNKIILPTGEFFSIRNVNWPIKKEKAANIVANNPHIAGEWDDTIGGLLSEVKVDFPDMFDNLNLDNLFDDLGIDDTEEDAQADEVPPIPEKAKTKLGDLYILGEHRLLCGDAIDSVQIDRLMDGKEADMVFTDPPYGLGGYGGRNKMMLRGDDQNIAPFYHAIPNTNEIYVWGRIYNFVDLNFIPRDIIIWKKNNFGLGRGYRGQYEVCFYKGKFKGSDSDVWEIDKDINYQHPTQKPVALCLRAIKNSNPKSVVDLFGGSGSTLIACEKANRYCYMMEIDPYYCDVIVKRWEDYTGKKAKKIK